MTEWTNDRFQEPDEQERLTWMERQPDDRDEGSLRPVRLAEFSGQERLKQNLSVAIEATRQRGEALDHVLLYGPPGLGKTSLAGIIANELGVNLKVTTGPAIEKPGDLAAILTNADRHDVLFIDEIHRLNRSVEEILYPAMEDYALDIMIGKGPSARSLRIDLQKFTLVGATTRAGLLTGPLRDRFGIIYRLELYSPEEICEILTRDAAILRIGINADGLAAIASRCRGTPRIAIRLLKRLRDFAQIQGKHVIDREVAEYGLNALDIDERGLDLVDRRMLRNMALMHAGGPVGLDTLAACTSEDASTIEDVYEPYLMQIGFLAKTPRGRMLTQLAWDHLKLDAPEQFIRNAGKLIRQPGVMDLADSQMRLPLDDQP